MESAGPLWSEVPKQIGVNFPPEFFLFLLNFLKVLDHCLRKRKTRLGERPGWYNRLVPVLRRGTVRGTRLSVAGNSSERNVRARMTHSECDIVSHCSSGCTATDCGAGSGYYSSIELQAPSSSEQEYSSRSSNAA